MAIIPKMKEPKEVTDYRPISLCNVLYKIIVKTIANRLKKCLPSIISIEQSAFVLGRQILDNILVAFETMHKLKRQKRGKDTLMALKLDISKAYDRVEWEFLELVMQRMGFDQKWIHLTMKCVRSVTYSILINGRIHGMIHPSRGLRQGDPLSPYLFLLCTEGLSSLLKKNLVEGSLHGIKIDLRGPEVSHLFFADDNLLFTQATMEACQSLISCFTMYENASGQKINLAKSGITFSPNTTTTLREGIQRCLNLQEAHPHDKYLGLPTFVGKSKATLFESIKARVWKKLQGWKGKLLSRAGKEVLIKAVAQAIPTYCMGCFKLPKKASKRL